MITRSRPAGITAAAVAVGIAAVLTGCGSQGQEGTTSSSFASAGVAPTVQHSHLGEVQREGRIQVCTTGDYRPYTYKDPKSGEWSGIDVDMARSLGKSLGAEVDFVQTSWANVVTDMDTSCDIAVGGISFTTDRAQRAAFSDTTSPDGKTPVVRCGEEEKYDTVAEINKPSVKVITPLGGTNEKFAEKNFPDAQVTKYKDNNTIFDQIVDGAADVMDALGGAHPPATVLGAPGQALRPLRQGLPAAAGGHRVGGVRGQLAGHRQPGRHQGRRGGEVVRLSRSLPAGTGE